MVTAQIGLAESCVRAYHHSQLPLDVLVRLGGPGLWHRFNQLAYCNNLVGHAIRRYRHESEHCQIK